MQFKKKLVFWVILCSLTACKHDPLDVSIDQTQVDIKFTHLDSLLYYTDETKLVELRKDLNLSINEIFDYQIGYCMQIGRVHDTTFVNSIKQYRADQAIQQLENEIATSFSNLQPYKNNLIIAFRYLKTHLPEAKMPNQIVFQNSLFNSSAFCTEKEIGIGLDQYLGKDSKTIKQLPPEPFYDWIKIGFDRRYLERDAVLSWILTHIVEDVTGNIAEQIIAHGKALYLTEASLPKSPKNIIVRYSEDDFKWANDNEFSFWKYLVDEKLLFKNDERVSTNLLKEGPFTAGLPEKGPDRLGQFLGWKIVKNYMEKTKISFEELLKTPYNQILQKYEPK
ncbi:MAG TPA: DUF2268 domain-containing putative Zn-dependent protease [Taishania sp.]|nr:DUF2268 domain-containing putative Zn-dependent protease [Taishania sp.]